MTVDEALEHEAMVRRGGRVDPLADASALRALADEVNRLRAWNDSTIGRGVYCGDCGSLCTGKDEAEYTGDAETAEWTCKLCLADREEERPARENEETQAIRSIRKKIALILSCYPPAMADSLHHIKAVEALLPPEPNKP